MALRDMMERHASSVFLSEAHHADSVVRRPLGVAAEDNPTIAMVIEWDDPTEMTEQGKKVRVSGVGHVASSVTLSVKDQFVIDSEVYSVRAIQPAQGGLQSVWLSLDKNESRKPGGGNLL